MAEKQSTFMILTVITIIATLTQISTDIYTPSLPAIAHHFHTTLGQSQWTMTFFVMGVAITTIIYGPLSEGIGRRLTIMLGIFIALIGTSACIFSQSIHFLQWGRFIQGCGLGACASLWRSTLRDVFSTTAMARVTSYLVSILTLSVILSPFVGGYFEHYLGWRATFIFLFCWMLAALFFIGFFFQETSQHHGKHRLNMAFLRQTYTTLFKDLRFMGLSFIVFLVYGGLLTLLTALPVIFIHRAGISPVVFGYLMMGLGLSTGVSGLINGRLTKKTTLTRLVTIGLGLMLLAGLILLLTYTLFQLQVAWILFSCMVFIFGSTFVFMNCFPLAFEHVGHISGYAGSLYSCIQLFGGVFFTRILGHLNSNSPVPMAIIFVVSAVSAYVVYLFLRYRQAV